MDSTIISGLISAAVTLVVCIITNAMQHRKTDALMEYKIGQLETAMNKHNNLIERMYSVEKRVDILDEKVSVANHRINDLENDGK